MSLAKLTQRLRAHDWTAAGIELLIVIVGILIALQVSNWNQDRLDRARGHRYAVRIHADLQQDIARIASTKAFWHQVSNYADQAIAHGESGALVDGSAWKTVLAYYQAGQLMPFELEDTSFLELRDAGEMNLIGDESLRKRLSSYYRMTGGGVIGEILHHNPVYREQIRGVTPTAVQKYIWSHCFRQLEGIEQELVDCPSPIPEQAAGAVLATYRSTAGLMENLRYWSTWLEVSQLVVGSADQQARALSAATLAESRR